MKAGKGKSMTSARRIMLVFATAIRVATAGEAPDFAETTVIDASAGATVAAGDLIVGDRAKVYKTGAGTLTVEANCLARTTDGRLTVLEGAVALTPGTAGDRTAPPAACQKAAFWVNPESVVTTNGAANADGETPAYAARWCDVRETDKAAPTRLYAEPKWFGRADLPAALAGVDPVTATFDGRTGVYFGGATSGQYMGWKRNGAAATLRDICHLFIVHAVTNCVGHPVGWEANRRHGPFLNTTGAKTPAFSPNLPMLVNRGDVCAPQMSARFFLDGEQVDPRTTPQRAGWQLFAGDYKDVLPGADNFFRSGFIDTLKGAQGGDYLGEVLVFTNRLSETERASVERYLLAKWGLPDRNGLALRTPGTQVTLADGTAATVSGAAGDVTTPLAFAGAGDVTKTGDGTLALGAADGLAFTGGFSWTGGALRLQGGRLPALAVAGGETYAFTSHMGTEKPSAAGDAASGLTCEKTTGGAGNVVATTGNGWLRVHTVEPGVRRLKVGIADAERGAVLQLEGRARQTAAPTGGGAEAVFPNPDIEQPFTVTDTTFDRTGIGASGNTLNGWTSRGGNPHFLCTQAPQTSARTWQTWFGAGDPAPRGGTNLLQLVQDAAVSTTVSVPTGGVYELSFDAKGRYNYTNTGSEKGYPYADMQTQLQILLGRTWDAATEVATLPVGCAQFNRFRFRIAVDGAGEWEVGFKPADRGWDACVFLDNFRMVRIAEPETEATCAIPNGSFDALQRPQKSAVDSGDSTYIRARYGTLNVPQGWTLSVLPGTPYAAVVTNGVVGAIASGTAIEKVVTMQVFPFAEAAFGGAALGFVATGGVASTTFTVPAGTWRLRGLVQRLATFMDMSPAGADVNMTVRAPAFRATVTRADGTTVALGEVPAATQRLVSARWPESFTVAADEQVTLTLTQANEMAMGLIDELALVRDETADFGNLIAEPGFETMTRWTSYDVPDMPATQYRAAQAVPYASNPAIWGYSAYEGAHRLRLQNRMGVYQDLVIPQKGRYRFTMHVRSRADSLAYANNPVRVWLAKGGVTNVLATTPSPYVRHWMEVSYLADVSEAGAWRLGIEGRGWMNDGDKPWPADLDVQIDAVSLVRDRDVRDDAPALPRDLRIDVAKGATLLLDYPGVARVRRIVYDGKSYRGTVNAKTCPEFVTGPGTLEAVSDSGALLIVR